MIKLKELIDGTSMISPSDIYDFYYLWYLYSNSPEIFSSEFAEYILNETLKNLKTKYIRIFKELIVKQINKYISDGRIDPDIDASKVNISSSGEELLNQMRKTYRSDMKRRNEVWNLACEFLSKLEKSSIPKDIFLNINALNMSIHNTQTLILGKLITGDRLMKALDLVSKSNHNYLRAQASKDIRQLDSSV